MDNNEILEILNRFAYRGRTTWKLLDYSTFPPSITREEVLEKPCEFYSYNENGIGERYNLDLLGAVAIAKHLFNNEVLQNYGFNEKKELIARIKELEKELSSFRAHSEMVKIAQSEMKMLDFKVSGIEQVSSNLIKATYEETKEETKSTEEIEFHYGDKVIWLDHANNRKIEGIVCGYNFQTKCNLVKFNDNEDENLWIHDDYLILVSQMGSQWNRTEVAK